MNQLTERMVISLVLNLVLPGAGYIYLKDKRRFWVAIPLLILTLYEIGYICFVFLTHSTYSYTANLSPFFNGEPTSFNVYSWLVWFVIGVDTGVEAKRLPDHAA